jgi:hypothetical protein
MRWQNITPPTRGVEHTRVGRSPHLRAVGSGRIDDDTIAQARSVGERAEDALGKG